MKTHTENRVHTTILRGLALLTLGLAVSSEAEAQGAACQMSTQPNMAVVTATKVYGKTIQTCEVDYRCEPQLIFNDDENTVDLSGTAVRVNGTGGSGKNGVAGTGCTFVGTSLKCTMPVRFSFNDDPRCIATIQGSANASLLVTNTVTCKCKPTPR